MNLHHELMDSEVSENCLTFCFLSQSTGYFIAWVTAECHFDLENSLGLWDNFPGLHQAIIFSHRVDE